MLEKEIERAGIPAVLVTALIPTALTVHANRVVQGIAITHPLGDPRVSRLEEKALRRRIVARALKPCTAAETWCQGMIIVKEKNRRSAKEEAIHRGLPRITTFRDRRPREQAWTGRKTEGHKERTNTLRTRPGC